ncbi:putative HTH-type transcriptional regulator [Mycobacterium simulans]|uniref:winged helix-turn-helix transcriptional regulator n=1 Tax=Mycobacterium simulans TaxID=627089 RepID=UPI00174E1151|nr:helix-turn-helix domain-containing protein [Mycobacterium simulans]SON60585.1 putative HTH-type transcriptional regulator [Mycobacterium simulans]
MRQVWFERDCSVFRAVAAVGDAWSWMVLREAIFDGICRFDEFQARLGIARSTLTARLDRLITSGLLERLGSDYVLTARGDDFIGCLLTAMHWGDRWCGDTHAAPVQVTHLGCGQPMHAEMCCEHCGQPVVARDVAFDRTPEPMRRPDGPIGRQRMPGLDLLERNGSSSIARTLQVLGDLWSALIIQECFFGTHRFDEFQQRLSIASNILSQRLSRLVERGVLTRSATTGPRHTYQLTDQGLDLYPVPLAMLTWGDRWLAGGDPPIKLSHKACGHGLRAILSCSNCTRPITRADLAIPSNA